MVAVLLDKPKVQKLRKSDLVISRLQFEGKPISFARYPLSRQIIDANAEEVLLKGGRQISKSMTLSNYMLSSIMGIPFIRFLYIAPKVEQTKVFSKDKIKSRITESPEFKKWYTDKTCMDNVFYKDYINGACVYFRAITQADAIRGISVNANILDEIQDIPSEIIPIVEETMSGREYNPRWYAGTPKSITNYIETLWQQSSQVVPVMVCPGGHHTIPSVKHVTPDGVRCFKCNEKIDVYQTYFKRMGPKDAEITGFWIPQIVLPLHANNPKKWAKLWRKRLNYSDEQFLNEVMGISAGEGMYLINKGHLVKACNQPDSFDMWRDGIQSYDTHGIREFVAGIDWAATNRRSYTVMFIGGWDVHENRFKIVYGKRFTTQNMLEMMNEIAKTIEDFEVNFVAADWGSGVLHNALLESMVSCPVFPVMYAGDRFRIFYDEKAGFYKASRNKTLIDTFAQIRAGRLHFYSWDEFKIMAPMFLAEFQEADEDNKGNLIMKFDHADDQPDDALHACSIMIALWKELRDPHGIRLPGIQ